MMKSPLLGALASFATILACGAAPATAETFPNKPIRIVVGFAAGSSSDTRVRQLAETASVALGQPIVVDNRPGAGATLAAELVAKSAPDRYTLLAATQAELALAPAVYSKLGYDPRNEFAAITQVLVGSPILVVSKGTDIKSVDDLIARAKAKPGQLSAASYGNGTC